MTTILSVPLSRMPVFVRAGGIIPEQSSATAVDLVDEARTPPQGPGPQGVLRLERGVHLYGDSGTGLGYARRAVHPTPIADSVRVHGSRDAATATRVTIGPPAVTTRGSPPPPATASRWWTSRNQPR